MRDLSELELRSVSGGATPAPVRRPVIEAIKRLLVRNHRQHLAWSTHEAGDGVVC